MSLFVEVNSVEKECKVIINLDEVIEIAPLRDGGSVLFFSDQAATNGRTAYQVKDDYNMFHQFVLQTVTAEDISARFPKKEKAEKEKSEKLEIPKL